MVVLCIKKALPVLKKLYREQFLLGISKNGMSCYSSCEDEQCRSKFFFTEHIQNIMTLEESVQHVVMTAIQEVSNN